jgi:hypothetical protein
MRVKLVLFVAVLSVSGSCIQAQAPVAAQPAPAVPIVAAQAQGSSAAVLQALQQVKAANDAMLKQQAATLQQLAEMEKAAEQLRIYTSRS